MFRHIKIVLALLVVVLLGTVKIMHTKNERLQEKLQISISNIKAYNAENDSIKDNNRLFKLTIDLLKYTNDSIVNKLKDVQKELKIKDKNLKSLQYLYSQSSRKDTIIMKDTLFRDPALNVDTTLGDKWYNINMKLKYPGTIIVNPSFNNEVFIITNYKKETINPPKKTKIGRWFLKKHQVVEIKIKDNNPYSKIKNQKFIEIIK